MNKELIILQLYPRDMNIYGDWGNVLTILRRAEWYGYKPKLVEYNPGDAFPDHVDMVIGGGGQDAGQDEIQADLLRISPKLHELAEADTPMLMICGLYQLFGKFFKTKDGELFEGIGIFDAETFGSHERLIGNITTESSDFGVILGYENHSGQTFLGSNATPLGTVRKGAGNNGEDGSEGARYRHVLGSYLHGSLLPKNPQIADWLLEKAAWKRHGEFSPHLLDDHFAAQARKIALKRPR